MKITLCNSSLPCLNKVLLLLFSTSETSALRIPSCLEEPRALKSKWELQYGIQLYERSGGQYIGLVKFSTKMIRLSPEDFRLEKIKT